MNTNRMNDRQRARRNQAQQAEVAQQSWEMFLADMGEEGLYVPAND